MDLSRIVPAEKAALIKEAFTRVQEDRLSSGKELLQDAATYDEIRLVKAAAQQSLRKALLDRGELPWRTWGTGRDSWSSA